MPAINDIDLQDSRTVRLKTACRILKSNLRERNLTETYWSISQSAHQALKLLNRRNKAFTKVVIQDMAQFAMGLRPESGNSRVRADAAVRWLLQAQEITGNGGVSHGYFPCNGGAGWRHSYPETTGYIITSLLRYAGCYGDEVVRQRALCMAEWEIQIQMPNGAVQGGLFVPTEKPTPCAFNTGMVLDGLCSAFEVDKSDLVLKAARRAADYLIDDLTDEGYFRTNGQYVRPGLIKTYNCLCAWSIYRLGLLAGDGHYKLHAVRIVEAAIRQQQSNGWFANNCLTRSEAPLLHTIAYTLQGILEVGFLSGREEFIDRVRLGVAPLLKRIKQNGFLAGRYYSDWEPASFSSCLTGSAQLAAICYRLYEHTREDQYVTAADRLVNFLKPLQRLDSSCVAIDGAISGSFPIFGEYMTAGYPNWATKYFLDALMLQDRLCRA